MLIISNYNKVNYFYIKNKNNKIKSILMILISRKIKK